MHNIILLPFFYRRVDEKEVSKGIFDELQLTFELLGVLLHHKWIQFQPFFTLHFAFAFELQINQN